MKALILSSLFSSLCVATGAYAQGLQAKLWVVSPSQAANVAFPPPSATPDVTFTTDNIAYVARGRTYCYSIGHFVASCPSPASNLAYSGLANPYLGVPVSGATVMSELNYGVIIEFTGQITLTTGQAITTSMMTVWL